MATKYTKSELEKMSSNDIAYYISEITQTNICKDLKYCNLILSIFLNK